MNIKSILKIGPGSESWSDSIGNPAAAPYLTFAASATVDIDLRSAIQDYESNVLPPYPASELSSVDSWTFAIDADFDRTTPPKYLLESGITKTATTAGTFVSIPLADFDTDALADALAGNQAATLKAELTGYDSSGNTVFVAQFPVTVRNRLYLPDTPPTPPPPTPPSGDGYLFSGFHDTSDPDIGMSVTPLNQEYVLYDDSHGRPDVIQDPLGDIYVSVDGSYYCWITRSGPESRIIHLGSSVTNIVNGYWGMDDMSASLPDILSVTSTIKYWNRLQEGIENYWDAEEAGLTYDGVTLTPPNE